MIYFNGDQGSQGTGSQGQGNQDGGGSPTGTIHDIVYAGNAPEVKNQVEKTCVKEAVDNVLNSTKGLKPKMGEILSKFVLDKNFIKIVVIGGSTPNGAAGSVISQSYDPNIRQYSATIQLDTDNQFTNSSQEFVASALIHEIGHAYIGYMNAQSNNLVNGNLQNNTHEYMSTNYIQPIAIFLKQTYGITDAEATALAWSGVTNSSAYTGSAVFSYGSLGETMSKEVMVSIIADFITGTRGSKICNN